MTPSNVPTEPGQPNFDRHSQRVWEFFGRAETGVFLDVGANHPTELSLTGFLEQQGWSGVLVEPNPELARLLVAQRPRSRTFQVAAGGPDMPDTMDLFLGVSHLHSTLAPVLGDPLSGVKVQVQVRTLDSLLTEAGIPRIDFMSIDVEGGELAVLRGLSLDKFQPRLILIEDKHHNYKKYSYLRQHGYRRVKRTDLNDWYVPNDSPATAANLNTLGERVRLFKKLWLNAPCDNAYKALRNRVRALFAGK